jgi:hypothetical protein
VHQVPDGALEEAGGGAQGKSLVVFWHETTAENAEGVRGHGALADEGRAGGLLVRVAHCWKALVVYF